MTLTHHPRTRRRSAALPALAALLLAAALAGCSTETGTGTAAAEPAGAPAAEKSAPAKEESAPATEQGSPATGKSAPVEVSIPSIKVASELMELGLNDDGTVEVPPPGKDMTAGWYTGGAVPGEPGAAVIIGHNETKSGPAVFKDLRKIGKGAEITVRNSAGKTARFTVTRTEAVRKNAFPTRKVYGETNGRRELRLITCDGMYDAQGHTVDNLIVYATLT
ncbi:class F sortase [Streptomyces sp. CAU 1734]|uniref:class F sortase n=1 Tax=Streptomyces sp. CAU 1734 TaxID=3140360 RepID=UPI0032605D8C